MRPLIFKSVYLDAIEEGFKTQTIRTWDFIPNGCKKDVIVTASNFKRTLKLRIVKVYKKTIKELTEREAFLDGFASKENLMFALKELYGESVIDKNCVVIRFEYMKTYKS